MITTRSRPKGAPTPEFSLRPVADCLAGPDQPWPGPPVDQDACQCLDADRDDDVDLEDFAVFQEVFSG